MRIKRLDILRCVAILMVVAAHARISPLAERVGWAGVDLFFVLSGFLISGLLYSEYKKRESISVRRFFIRRGFKIYPAFYLMLLATFIAQALFWHAAPQPLPNFLREVFFVQNYRFAIWTHTWSLAVEEHFYIGLALLLLILARSSAKRSNPFEKIPLIFLMLAGTCLVLRILTIWLTPASKFQTSFVMNPTHTRIDGLFFGVLIGYLYHFRPEVIKRIFRPGRNRVVIGILTTVLLSTCYFFSRDDHFLLTFGLTFLYLGFGALLIFFLEVRNVLSGKPAGIAEKVGTGCAYVGTHSYSIYLWHVPFLVAVSVFLRKVVHTQLPSILLSGVYVLGSCALGILLANLIEFPILRLRDRLFPALQKPVITNAANQGTADSCA